jgi:hypothetical protein
MSTQPRRIPQATSPAPALMPNQARSWLRRGWKKLLAATFLCGAFSAGLRTDRGAETVIPSTSTQPPATTSVCGVAVNTSTQITICSTSSTPTILGPTRSSEASSMRAAQLQSALPGNPTRP